MRPPEIPRAFVFMLWVGLAESGQRREERPPSGWIKVRLNFYFDLTPLKYIKKIQKSKQFDLLTTHDQKLRTIRHYY